ncbi:MAG: VCBS repeat-containing protein, partial [Planctomycetota bacterium]|nr:VCBS repeat-containing protein [Planctomycetota bacterium]
MQVRAVLLAFALFGAGCRSVSAPAAPPPPQFIARPAWEVVPIERNNGDSLELANLGDLDGDGYDELAARELSSTQCRAALVRGRDGYSTMEALNVATSPHNRKDAWGSLELAHGFVNVGDTDGDGLPEIAVIECGYTEFARFPPSGVWLLAADPWHIVKVWRRDVTSFGAHLVPIGDFDGDGLADI